MKRNYGVINAYLCGKCRGIIVTEDLEEGVTPFIIRCRATKDCDGGMHSSMYCGPFCEAKIKPHYIWRKPTLEEYEAMSFGMKAHIDAGGLELYPNGEHS